MVSSNTTTSLRTSLQPTRPAASTLALTSSQSAHTPYHSSSVSSRTSVRRGHRQHRSHHGGASLHRPQNEFPTFTHTGDVEICLGPAGGAPQERRYLLHRLILAQCSGFFEAGTSEEWSKAQQVQTSGQELSRIGENGSSEKSEDNERAATVYSSRRPSGGPPTGLPGPTMRWRYELDWGRKEDDDIPMLIQKNDVPSIFGGESLSRPPPTTTKSASAATPQGFFRAMAGNFSTMNISRPSNNAALPPDDPFNETLRDYDNLFRIFYNYAPALDPINIANAYIECKSLLNLADMYDAIEVVGPRIDHHLLQFQGRLWKQIAKYPSSYLKLGYLARSKVIFSEALVHVVGQWPLGANHLRQQLSDQVLDIIEDKVDMLEEEKAKIEGSLFRLTLLTSRGERVTPSNSYLDWTAVSLFRQWLAENTTPPPAPNHKDTPRPHGSQQAPLPPPPPTANAGRIYRLLGTGGQAYLSHEEVKRFLKLRPEEYSRENLRRFERRLDELKQMAQNIARPLMRNSLELDLGRDGAGVAWLTCTKIEERDFPWED